MKKGRISEQDKNFIIKNSNMSVKNLAKKLDRTEESIEKILSEVKQPAKVISQTEVHHRIKDNFARNQRAIVMTPAVASTSEDIKHKRDDETCIFRINSQKKSY